MLDDETRKKIRQKKKRCWSTSTFETRNRGY